MDNSFTKFNGYKNSCSLFMVTTIFGWHGPSHRHIRECQVVLNDTIFNDLKKKILQWTFDFSGLFLKFFPVLKSCKSDLSHVHTEQYTYTVQTHNVPNGSKNNKPDFQKKNPISGLFLAYSRYFPLFFFGLYLHDAHRFLYYLHAASHSKISEYLLKFMLNDKIVKRCKTLETENR